MACDEHGIFVNSDCYVITHTCRSTDDVRHTIFYWLVCTRHNVATAINKGDNSNGVSHRLMGL